MTTTSAIKDIFVVVDMGGERLPVAVALDLAAATGAHVTGISTAFQPIVPVYTMAAPVPTDFIVAAHEQVIADSKSAISAFEDMARASGAPFDGRSIESVAGDGFIAAVRSFQLSDLVVIGQQDPDRLEPMREGLIEAVLFQANAPVLLVPYSGVSALKPAKVVIAWDGGAAAARAVRSALPLLAMADEVQVVTVAEPRKQVDAPGAMIARYLARHGLNVETHQIEPAGNDVGGAIMQFTAEKEAGLLVMGAYGHSRVREFFLGGTTREALASATVPVFMAH